MTPRNRIPAELARQALRGRRNDLEAIVTPESRRIWAQVLERIRAARMELDVRENEDWWYRGQASTHKLRPSLFRLLEQKFTEIDGDPKSIYELEYDLYFEFSCLGPGMQETGLSSWDKLFYMRHHGLPTRLLDWTESLGIAIFFALSSASRTGEGLPVIWVLNPARLNELVLEVDRDLYSPRYLGYDWENDEEWDYEDFLIFASGKFDWEGPVAIYPEQKNPRMRSQHGLFTIFGEIVEPLEKQFPEVLRSVEIPEVAIPAAHEFLDEAGIDESVVYPDLDGFVAAMLGRYGLKPSASR
jgi:hypothetical protein